jgi:hypothetical protein
MDTNPMHGGFSSGINQYYLLGGATTRDLKTSSRLIYHEANSSSCY